VCGWIALADLPYAVGVERDSTEHAFGPGQEANPNRSGELLYKTRNVALLI
jgi:hypothetical protein